MVYCFLYPDAGWIADCLNWQYRGAWFQAPFFVFKKTGLHQNPSTRPGEQAHHLLFRWRRKRLLWEWLRCFVTSAWPKRSNRSMLGMKNHSYNHLLFRWRRKCLLRASVGNVYEIRCFATLLLSAWQSSTKCFFFVSLILQLAEKRLLRKIVGNVFTYKILRFTQNDKALLNVFYFVLMNGMKPGTHLLHAEVLIVLMYKMLRNLSMTKKE